MISIVIRNKNEAKNLEIVLAILNDQYKGAFDEIILVDNLSYDNSIEIATKYNCKVVTIEHFTYGKAINLGIKTAKNDCVLLLSAHAVPTGKYFFKSILDTFNSNENIAGIRFINSYQNYLRAFENNFVVTDGIRFGLMAACAVIRKSVWEDVKFDENLPFSEDKDWSKKVMDKGKLIVECNEYFYYFSKTSQQGLLKRYKNELEAHYLLNDINYPSKAYLIGSFVKIILIKNTIRYWSGLKSDFSKFLIRLKLTSKFKK